MINRIQLVLKPEIPDVVGEKIRRDAGNYLQIETGRVKTGKIYNITYDLTPEQIATFARQGLADGILHDVYTNSMFNDPLYQTFVLVARLPGVTDDEGMSAQRTLSDILDLGLDTATQHIFSQDIYLFESNLPDNILQQLAHDLLGNPLVNHFEYGSAGKRIDYMPYVEISTSGQYETVDILVEDEQLLALSRERLLSLNLEEMQAIRDYFRNPERQSERKLRGLPSLPTDCELEVLAQTWSEHCKHKEFSAVIEFTDLNSGETLQIDSLFQTYIKQSTEIIRQRLSEQGNNWLLKVFSDNAGVVKIDDDHVFVWKVETHNSPSAIDPYGGAITGILGNNRDPLGTGVGGGRLLFNTNVLCFGPPDYSQPLLPGQLHPRRVLAGVRHGIEDGGNKSGIPTVNGAIVFDDRYSGKPLVYCGTGGVMPMSYQGRSSWEKRIDPGDLIFMAGGRVGKDGIHGATFSSAEINEHSPQSAVQIGSPITQKLLSDFLEEACRLGLVKCSTDNGAGGLSSSVGELAQISGGARVDLENVPLKYANLAPWEIFISESQERMTLVIEPSERAALLELAARREVEMTEVGIFTDSGLLEVYYGKVPVCQLDLAFLHHGVPRKYLQAEWSNPSLPETVLPEISDFSRVVLQLMGSYNICSREAVIRQYDHEVKGKTIIKPLMGPAGKTPQDAAVLRLFHDSWAGIAVSNGILPRYGDLDPYQMSAGAFDEAVRQIIAVGGLLPFPANHEENLFWSVNDNFCVPDSAYDPVHNPDGKQKLGKLVRMNQALFDMSTFFNIPLTSGKDSMKNDFKSAGRKISVPPTILYSMVAKIPDVRKTVTSDLKAAGDLIYQLGETYNELGGSEFFRLFGATGTQVPQVRKGTALDLYLKVMQANRSGLIQSCHDISDGGLAVALAETLFGTGLGADISLLDNELSPVVQLFSESHSRFIASVRREDQTEFEKLMAGRVRLLGEVTESGCLQVRIGENLLFDLTVSALQEAWDSPLSSVLI